MISHSLTNKILLRVASFDNIELLLVHLTINKTPQKYKKYIAYARINEEIATSKQNVASISCTPPNKVLKFPARFIMLLYNKFVVKLFYSAL